MTRHLALLWTDTRTGRIQVRCLCNRWESEVLPPTRPNRTVLLERGHEHEENPE